MTPGPVSQETIVACKIDDLIKESVVTMDETASVQRAAELMNEQNTGSLVVTREGRVVGLFTERDLLRRVVSKNRNPADTRLSEVSTQDLVSIRHDSTCEDAIRKMRSNYCRRLVVYRGDRFAGMLSLPDVASALAEKGHGKDLLVNAFGAVTFVVALGVIAMLIYQLPAVMQLAGRVTGP